MLPIKLVVVRICNFAGNELRLRFWTRAEDIFSVRMEFNTLSMLHQRGLGFFDIAKMIILEAILLESPNFLKKKRAILLASFFCFLFSFLEGEHLPLTSR